MNKKRFYNIAISLLFLIQSLTASAQPDNDLGYRLPDGRLKYTIPFELVNNLIVVKVVLNNTLPLKFIVDTGVRTSILTEKTFTDLLNISYSRKITIPGAGGQKLVDAYVATNITLDIEGVVGKGHALLVLEEDLLQLKNFLGHNVQGILGFELFSRFIIDINYKRQTMTLYEPEAFEKLHIERKKKFYAIPITVEDTKPYCYTKVTYYNGPTVTTKLMLDTGASHAVLLDENSNEDIQIPENNIYSNLGRGLAGDINGKIARLAQFDMGPFQFNDVITIFPEKSFYMQSYRRVYRNGTLGGGILSRFRVIFNFMDGYIYLKKNSSYRNGFDYNMSGVIILAKGLYLNSFEIVEVRENSEAEDADIKPGDLIIRINNHPTHSLELGEINGVFNSKPNRTIRLDLYRDGITIKRKFKLKRVI